MWGLGRESNSKYDLLTPSEHFRKVRKLQGYSYFPVDTGRKLKVHKTFRRRPGRVLNVLCTFKLRPVSTG